MQSMCEGGHGFEPAGEKGGLHTKLHAVGAKGIPPCIPCRKSRGKAVRYDKRRYLRRNRIEIMFSRLKDWRRVAN